MNREGEEAGEGGGIQDRARQEIAGWGGGGGGEFL